MLTNIFKETYSWYFIFICVLKNNPYLCVRFSMSHDNARDGVIIYLIKIPNVFVSPKLIKWLHIEY